MEAFAIKDSEGYLIYRNGRMVDCVKSFKETTKFNISAVSETVRMTNRVKRLLMEEDSCCAKCKESFVDIYAPETAEYTEIELIHVVKDGEKQEEMICHQCRNK